MDAGMTLFLACVALPANVLAFSDVILIAFCNAFIAGVAVTTLFEVAEVNAARNAVLLPKLSEGCWH